MKLISLIYIVAIARPSFSVPLVNGDPSLLNQEDNNNLDRLTSERSNRNSSINHEKVKTHNSSKDISESGQNEGENLDHHTKLITENVKNNILVTKIHGRKSVESSNSKIIQTDVSGDENDPKIRMCVHKFNVAQTNGAADKPLLLSSADYDESEYEEYGNID